jgi:outer membrane protein
MKPTRGLPCLMSVCAIALSSANIALAGETYRENEFSVGGARYLTHDRAPDISGPFTPPNLNLDVRDANTVGVQYTRFVNANIGFSALVGWPIKQSVRGTKDASVLGEIATAKQAAPTLLVQYHFGDESAVVRPLVGIGVNYTKFFSIKSSTSLATALGGPTELKLSSSTGLAGQVGANLRVADGWALSLRYLRAKVKSKADIVTGPITRRTDIDVRPEVVFVGMSYGF